MIPIRKAVLGLAPYNAPKEGRAAKLRLDFNENTVGCSPAVVRALSRMTPKEMAIYPEYQQTTRRLAKFFGVRPAEMHLTNGIDDALHLIADTFIEDGDSVLVVEPTFDMYRFFSELAGARVIALRYDEEMRFPVEAVIRAVRGPRKKVPRVLYIANPNNPTGTLVRREELRRILSAAAHTLVLVDEAYFDFSGLTILPWIRRYPNLLVARTFSKSAGLAALRVGCLFGKAEMLSAMRRACTPYPVNSAALVAAEAAVRDPQFLRSYTREVLQSRALLEKGLVRLGARIYPSSANFVLADFGSAAPRLVRALERKGILVRGRRDFPRVGFVRISAGTRADTRKVLRAMEGIL
ncbi:MAG TPA: histidinol-phosphate transaminase [Candidatus Acidoferrales bacterium]|nr:histidinol-phosphate transaminase [Candidatus Acidoferrales bacterium]